MQTDKRMDVQGELRKKYLIEWVLDTLRIILLCYTDLVFNKIHIRLIFQTMINVDLNHLHIKIILTDNCTAHKHEKIKYYTKNIKKIVT